MTFDTLLNTAPKVVKTKLEQLKTLRERPDFHPENSTFEHIQIVTNRLIPTGNMNLIFAGILHDICKLDMKKINKKTGLPTSPGHDIAAKQFILDNQDVKDWITQNDGDFKIVAELSGLHMKFHQIGDMRKEKREKRVQEWTDAGIFDMLQMLGGADNMLVEFDLNNLDKSFKFNRK